MTFGIHAENSPYLMLEPKAYLPTDEQQSLMPLRFTDVRELLAFKLARLVRKDGAMEPGDMIDAYSLLTMDPPIMNLDRASPTNDLELIRTLFVAKIPYFKATERDVAYVDERLQPTQQNIEALSDVLREHVFLPEYEKAPELAKKILEKLNGVYEDVFPALKVNPKTMTLDEMSAEQAEGLSLAALMSLETMGVYAEGGHQPLSENERKYVELAGAAKTKHDIKPELLARDHPEVFEAHPELARRISLNPHLHGVVDQNRRTRGDISPDGA